MSSLTRRGFLGAFVALLAMLALPSIGHEGRFPHPSSLSDQGVFDVRAYGAVCDGRDDTVAIQAAFDAADAATVPASPSFFVNSVPVRFPRGNCLTGKITWKGQSIIGAGSADTILTGKSSQDILFADPTAAQNEWDFTIEGISFNVDDTTDVSGSLNRSGVGNAAIAVEFNDGDRVGGPTGKWTRCRFRNVLFRSTSYVSGGQNSSAGEYFQGHFKQSCSYENVQYWRLEYSLYEDAPNLNTTSVELFRDYNEYTNLFLNGTKNGPRFINNQHCVISGAQIGSFDTGLVLTGIQTQTRAKSTQCSILSWFGEQLTGPGTNAMQIDGADHTLLNITSSSSVNGAKITLNADDSTWIGGFLSNGDNTSALTVAGDRNRIERLAVRSPSEYPVDTGRGNTILSTRLWAGGGAGGEQLNLGYSTLPVNVRDIDAIHRGYTATPYLSARNLFADPSVFHPIGGTVTHVADSTADFGSVIRITGTGGAVSWNAQDPNQIGFPGGLKIPDFLPATLVRVFVKAKIDVAESALLNFKVDTVVQPGSKSIAWTTAFTVGYIDVDLSGLTSSNVLQIAMNNTVEATATQFDIAWVAFLPVSEFTLQKNMLLVDGVTAPATEAAFAQTYVDTADGDLKVKFGDGVVKTIVTDAALASAVPTVVCDFSIEAPVTGDDGNAHCHIPNAATLVRAYCSTSVGTSNVNFYERTEGAPNTGTTGLLTSNLLCGITGANSSTFADSIVGPSDKLIALGLITPFTTGWLRAHLEYTVD